MADTTKEIMEKEARVEQGAAEMAEEAEKTGVINIGEAKEKKDQSMNYTHKFKKPVTIEGKRYASMTFYFEKLTGEDIEAIEAELQDSNRYVLSPEISSVFQSMLAARAAGVGSDEIRRLPAGDYMKIKNHARDFLVDVGY